MIGLWFDGAASAREECGLMEPQEFANVVSKFASFHEFGNGVTKFEGAA